MLGATFQSCGLTSPDIKPAGRNHNPRIAEQIHEAQLWSDMETKGQMNLEEGLWAANACIRSYHTEKT